MAILSGIDPYEKRFDYPGGHAWGHVFMASSKLEARGHLLHKTDTLPNQISRECIKAKASVFIYKPFESKIHTAKKSTEICLYIKSGHLVLSTRNMANTAQNTVFQCVNFHCQYWQGELYPCVFAGYSF